MSFSGQILMARNADEPDELVPAQLSLEAPAAATSSIDLAGQLFTQMVAPSATETLVLSGQLQSDDPLDSQYPNISEDGSGTVEAQIIDAQGNAYTVTVTLVKVVDEAERVEYEVVFDKGLETEFRADETVVYLLEPVEGEDSEAQWVLENNGVTAQFFREVDSESSVTVNFELDLAGGMSSMPWR